MCAENTAKRMAEISKKTGEAGRPGGGGALHRWTDSYTKALKAGRVLHRQGERTTQWAERSPSGWKMEQGS